MGGFRQYPEARRRKSYENFQNRHGEGSENRIACNGALFRAHGFALKDYGRSRHMSIMTARPCSAKLTTGFHCIRLMPARLGSDATW
jgi:hypothetical protein